jgi:hypothetical protein
MESVRACDALPYLRLKQKMEASRSDCNAVLKDGSTVQVYIFQDKPAIEVGEQFYFADTYPDFVRYEKKPLAAPIRETVQLPDKPIKDEPVAGSQSVQIAERWNGSQLYKRNLVREQHGNLVVEKFIGVDQQNPHVRYYLCRCKCHNREVRASQSDILMSRVTSCQNEKPIPPTVSDGRIRNTAGLF